MSQIYFDCFCGAAGDMIVAGLIDAGADYTCISNSISQMNLEGTNVSVESVRRGGLAGKYFRVETPQDQPPRHLPEILRLIESSDLPSAASERAAAVFGRLARAEAQVHGVKVEEVHFHEVGAVDSIVDIVSACVGIDSLAPERIVCSPLPLGSGSVQTAHGLLPVPAPATAELLRGVPTCPGPADGELTTPTAAALLRELADEFGPPPAMTIRSVGYGAGSREIPGAANLLRVLVGEADPHGEVDSLVELSANLDDCTGEILGVVLEKLLAAGCLDAWVSPAYTKKHRPAWTVSALAQPKDVIEAERILFTETTTLGVRRRPCERSKLPRRTETVETPFGPIRVKVALLEGREVTAGPEFADCQTAAEAHNVPVKEVYRAAQFAWKEK